jgi:hypothetical protein
MPSARRISFATACPQMLRQTLALCLVLTYLVSGVLHQWFDLDVAHPSFGRPEVVVMIDKAGISDQTTVAGHDCHGCFSVVMPQPLLTAVAVTLVAALSWRRPADEVGIVPDIESPPPRA